MGLVNKTVKVKWSKRTKKHYINKGYIFTNYGDEFEVKIEDLSKGSISRLNCICDNCNKELDWGYTDYINQVKEDGKTYCQKCGTTLLGRQKINKTKLSKSKSFYDWCIESDRQDVLDRWDYELNGCSPKDICYSSNKKYWFKCNKYKEHKSELKKLNGFTSGQEGSMDCKQCNSFAQYIIDNYGDNALELYWDYEKNTVDPWEISRGCKKKVWIKCQEKDCHGSYEIRCNNFTSNNQRCPECIKERKESIIEEKTKLYLEELGYEVKTEYNCSLIPINPKTNRPLPFDNEIVLENEKRLIIEVHGSQHYYIDGYYTKTEEELHNRQLIDRYKRIKCIQAGYNYLGLPYWMFNNNEDYKKLIENKIREILDK